MPINTTVQKNTLASAYAAAAVAGAIYTTAPGATAGTEPTGGSPTYARKTLSWGAPTGGVVATTATPFDVPSGSNVQGAGLHSLVSGGVYLDGVGLTPQSFASQGTFTVTFTYTQT